MDRAHFVALRLPLGYFKDGPRPRRDENPFPLTLFAVADERRAIRDENRAAGPSLPEQRIDFGIVVFEDRQHHVLDPDVILVPVPALLFGRPQHARPPKRSKCENKV